MLCAIVSCLSHKKIGICADRRRSQYPIFHTVPVHILVACTCCTASRGKPLFALKFHIRDTSGVLGYFIGGALATSGDVQVNWAKGGQARGDDDYGGFDSDARGGHQPMRYGKH